MDWRNVRTSFLERRIHLMENNLWTDCVFTIGPDRVYFTAHKLLLAMASPVFEALFFQDNIRVEFPLHFENDPVAFKKLLQYIYSEKVVMNTYVEAREVHRTSKKFAMTGLEQESLRRIKETVTRETACNLLEYANSVESLYEIRDGKTLKEWALQIIIRETSHVLQAPSFTQIQLATLEEILRIDELNVQSELELVNAVLNWARENSEAEPLTTESLHAVAAPAIRHLRLLTLTSQQVVEGVVETPLMTTADCLTVLQLVAVAPPGRVPPPAAFSPCRQRRGPNVRAGHEHCPPRNPLCGTPGRENASPRFP